MDVDKIKNLVLIALASDDTLLETLVLKGGNAVALLERDKNKRVSRASYDLDYSIATDFDEDIERFKDRFHKTLSKTFQENGYVIFDYDFHIRPSKPAESTKDFWGGYNIQFKIASDETYQKLKDQPDELRKYALKVMPNGSPKVEIEISKYEYVEKKMSIEVDGYVIYIYTPEMIVFEKLRAICQQHPEYATIIPSHSPRPRARDFYDIHLICETHEIDFNNAENKKILDAVFQAKRVPIEFLKLINQNSALHRQDWQSVLDTLSAQEDVKDFDFYLNYITQIAEVTFP